MHQCAIEVRTSHRTDAPQVWLYKFKFAGALWNGDANTVVCGITDEGFTIYLDTSYTGVLKSDFCAG